MNPNPIHRQRRRSHAASAPLPYGRQRAHAPTFPLSLSLLVSLALTLPILLLMILLAALVLTQLPDPSPLLKPIALTLTAFGALLGGFLTVRFHPKRGIISGGAFGGIYGIVILLSAIAFGVTNALFPLLSIPICTLLAAAAGYLGLPKTHYPQY